MCTFRKKGKNIFMKRKEYLKTKIVNVFNTSNPKNTNNQECRFTKIEFSKFEPKEGSNNSFLFEFKTHWKELNSSKDEYKIETITGTIDYDEKTAIENIYIKFDKNATFEYLGEYKNSKLK